VLKLVKYLKFAGKIQVIFLLACGFLLQFSVIGYRFSAKRINIFAKIHFILVSFARAWGLLLLVIWSQEEMFGERAGHLCSGRQGLHARVSR
jgi:hypothetical protein